jgi:hypothetical protein
VFWCLSFDTTWYDVYIGLPLWYPGISERNDEMIRKIVIAVILTYRLIPCRIRRSWSRGQSTSHRGLAQARAARTGKEAVIVLARHAFGPWMLNFPGGDDGEWR